MQKEAQRKDRILAYGNRTLHMPESNFSSFKNGLSGGILCFEHNVDKTYLKDLPSDTHRLKSRQFCKTVCDFAETSTACRKEEL